MGTLIDLGKGLLGLIDKILPDGDKKIELKNQVQNKIIEADADFRKMIVELQTHSSGSVGMDAYRASVRPTITYLLLANYMMHKFGWLPPETWTQFDSIILASAITFYFGSRGIEKMVMKTI
jgi:hypothetical protein